MQPIGHVRERHGYAPISSTWSSWSCPLPFACADSEPMSSLACAFVRCSGTTPYRCFATARSPVWSRPSFRPMAWMAPSCLLLSRFRGGAGVTGVVVTVLVGAVGTGWCSGWTGESDGTLSSSSEPFVSLPPHAEEGCGLLESVGVGPFPCVGLGAGDVAAVGQALGEHDEGPVHPGPELQGDVGDGLEGGTAVRAWHAPRPVSLPSVR